MNRHLITAVAAAALLAGSAALAQPSPSPRSERAQVSETDLEAFADIYVDLQRVTDRFEAQIAAAQTDREAQEVRSQRLKESTATVVQHGWTPEKYKTVAAAINADPDVADKVLAMVDERSARPAE